LTPIFGNLTHNDRSRIDELLSSETEEVGLYTLKITSSMETNANPSPSVSLTENKSRESIAVIGGGPGAMFFCHAIESKRKELLLKGQDASGFPVVTCFERAPGPGGVWRNDRKHESVDDEHIEDTNVVDSFFVEEKKDDDYPPVVHQMTKKIDEMFDARTQDGISLNQGNKTPNMYSALWTNGPKEGFEFSDYTFLDHFGDVQMPTFLPRKHVLDYILARCTAKCPNFFEKYFSFRTSVVNVSYEKQRENEEISEHSTNHKFRVHTRNENTGIEEINIFDKCIWAGGNNGLPYMPTKMLNLFKNGGFEGSLVHSSDTTNFKKDVENKRVLIIGGGFSAEDLALMAIKEGASRIFCTYRGSDEKEMSWTTRWPYDKVEVYKETTVVNVENSTITIQECERDEIGCEYYRLCDAKKTVLKDIDTVIFCTGYSPNANMLDKVFKGVIDDDDDCESDDGGFKMPKGWNMNKDEELETLLGRSHVKPSKIVYPCIDFENCSTNLYRGCILKKNPNMMFMVRDFSSIPLMEADITAWMLASFVTGQKALPSSEEMDDEMDRITLECMENISVRYKMDSRFNKAITKVYDSDGFNEKQNEVWNASEEEDQVYQIKLLGRMMNDGGYPYSYISEDGTSFSEIGNKIVRLNSILSREIMNEIKYDEHHGNSPGWMTFRDYPNAEKYVSVFTGIKSCRLPKPWFELDENDKLW